MNLSTGYITRGLNFLLAFALLAVVATTAVAQQGTAIALIAGMDAVINAIATRPAGRPNAGGGQDLGMPGGIDLGIGLP